MLYDTIRIEESISKNNPAGRRKSMKTVVITGSARGFGLCQAKKFKELGFNVVISDINEANLSKALEELSAINPENTKAVSVVCNVTSHYDLENLWNKAVETFGGYLGQ